MKASQQEGRDLIDVLARLIRPKNQELLKTWVVGEEWHHGCQQISESYFDFREKQRRSN